MRSTGFSLHGKKNEADAARDTRRFLPAQPFDQQCGHLGNFPRKLHGIDTFENDIVGFHGIRTGERRSRTVSLARHELLAAAARTFR